MDRIWHSITFSDIHRWTTSGQNVSDAKDVVFRILHFNLEWSGLTWKVLVRIQLFWKCPKLEMDYFKLRIPFLFETSLLQDENTFKMFLQLWKLLAKLEQPVPKLEQQFWAWNWTFQACTVWNSPFSPLPFPVQSSHHHHLHLSHLSSCSLENALLYSGFI